MRMICRFIMIAAVSVSAACGSGNAEEATTNSPIMNSEETTPAEATEPEMPSDPLREACRKNLIALGELVADRGQKSRGLYPEADDVKGNLFFEATDIDCTWDDEALSLFGCPADSGYVEGSTFRLRNNTDHPDLNAGDFHPDCITSESYIYLSHLLLSEEEGLAFLEAYLDASPDDLTKRYLEVPEGEGNRNSSSINRLSVGVDRFLITDINAAMDGFAAQIPVIWEWPSNHVNGGHVLYMDRHVEFVTYPGEFPMTERFIEALRKLEPEFSEDIHPINTK